MESLLALLPAGIQAIACHGTLASQAAHAALASPDVLVADLGDSPAPDATLVAMSESVISMKERLCRLRCSRWRPTRPLMSTSSSSAAMAAATWGGAALAANMKLGAKCRT